MTKNLLKFFPTIYRLGQEIRTVQIPHIIDWEKAEVEIK